MSATRDWRPPQLNVEALATDAQLHRIEAKIDQLFHFWFTEQNEQHEHQFEQGRCPACGQRMKAE